MKICPKCLKQYGDEHTSCADDQTELRLFNDQALKLIGKVVAQRFRIDEKIGEGGMGEVFRGTQLSVNRPVALKVLRPAMAVSEEYVNRFFREANMASTINHPNFVHIYDFGQDEEHQVLFLAMELLHGMDLHTRMLDGQMRLEHILEIGIQICTALEAAHRLNIVHRDLKPENVFLVDMPGTLHVKILDFGIAKEIGNTQSMTKAGQIFGTPDYMSPEQCQGSSHVDGRSDLYALGCVVYELLTGRPPYASHAVVQTLLAHVKDPLPDMKATGAAVPSGIELLVTTLLQKNPAHRYSSAAIARLAFQNELDHLLANPDQTEIFADSKRRTFDPHRSSSDARSEPQLRHASQLINLGHLSHLDTPIPMKIPESSPVAFTSRLIWGLMIVVVLAAGWALSRDTPPAPLETTNLPSIAAQYVPKAIATARQMAEDVHTLDSAVVLGRNVSILATSIAIVGFSPSEIASVRVRRRESETPMLTIRTPTSIEKRASQLSRGLLACFGQRSNPEEAGDVTFGFRILPDGGVDAVQIKRTVFQTEAVNTCIRNTVSDWTFGAAGHGAGVVSHERTVSFGVRK